MDCNIHFLFNIRQGNFGVKVCSKVKLIITLETSVGKLSWPEHEHDTTKADGIFSVELELNKCEYSTEYEIKYKRLNRRKILAVIYAT